MRTLRSLAIAVALILPAQALAQLDDDLLAPLTEEPKKKKKRAPRKEKKVEEKAAPEDDLFESLVSNKTELLVKLPSGFKGATLFVDGKDLGQVTGGAVELAPGEHTVTLKRIGYADFSKKVQVAANKLTELAASLEPVAGVLAVSADPADAEILVDGKLVGQGSVKDIPLIPGTRTVTVRKSGMQEEKVQLAVKPGKDYPVTVSLKAGAATKVIVAQNADRPENTNLTNPNVTTAETAVPLETETELEGETPMYKRWYVWAGIGAVVAGAAAGIAVASSNSGGGTGGGVQPSTVCGGACDGTINWPGLRF